MTDNRAFLTDYIRVLINRTKSGEIKWLKVNPSTFEWSQSINGIEHIASVQKVRSPNLASLLSGKIEETYKYIFQVVEKDSQDVKILISSNDKFSLNDELQELYVAIDNAIDSVSVDVLKNLLGL